MKFPYILMKLKPYPFPYLLTWGKFIWLLLGNQSITRIIYWSLNGRNPGAQNLAGVIPELVAVLRLEYLVVLKSESVAVLIGICIDTQIF